jgi:general secretion pathway protein K
MRSRRCNARQQRGAALVVAMLVFALCAALIVAMKSEFTRLYQRGANLFLAEQAHAYLRGAEELATLALLVDYDRDKSQQAPRDDLEEIWAQPPAPYALDEGGWLMGSLTDLQGRFNLNALAARPASSEGGAQPGEQRFTPAQAQFIRLLQALEEPQVSQQDAILITESIADWLDPDGNPALNGAEDDYYFGLTPAYRAANRAMASVSELRAVAYVSSEIYRALESAITVWPETPGPINIHTAPALVLRSINADDDLSPLSVSEGEALLAVREDVGFADLDDFLANPVFDGRRERMEKARTLLGEASSCFLLEAEVEVADRQMRLYSVLERHQGTVTALVRAGDSL